MKLYYPHRPYLVTQKWGVYNPAYEQLGFKNHNGIDSFTGKVDWQGKVISEYAVVCPAEGMYVERVQYAPEGGGHEIFLRTKGEVEVGGVKCHLRIILCHAKKILVKAGYEPALGELIMVADNTGFSTGIHTHTGVYRLDKKGNKLDINDATGSYDPDLLYTGEFAQAKATTATILKSYGRYYSYLIGLN